MKKSNGISLIMLIITVIILIILTSTILVAGNNLIKKAQYAQFISNISSAQDIINIKTNENTLYAITNNLNPQIYKWNEIIDVNNDTDISQVFDSGEVLNINNAQIKVLRINPNLIANNETSNYVISQSGIVYSIIPYSYNDRLYYNATTFTSNVENYPYLADVSKIGDYVNYPITYNNVNTEYGFPTTGTGWRIISINKETKEVKIVSEGAPYLYKHVENSQTSILNLTTRFKRTIFKNSLGQEDFGSAMLDTHYGKEVRCLSKSDIDQCIGQTIEGQIVPDDLFCIGDYCWLSTINSDTNLWRVSNQGEISSRNNFMFCIRPVITLHLNIKSINGNGTGLNPWQLEKREHPIDLIQNGDYFYYPVNYSNVNTEYGFPVTGTGWRIIDINYDENKIKIISEGAPFLYSHEDNSQTSIENLVTNFETTSFLNSFGETVLGSTMLLPEYPATVRCVKKEDIDTYLKIITTEGEMIYDNLVCIGDYCWLATINTNTNLWRVSNQGEISNRRGFNFCIRPVIELDVDIANLLGNGTSQNPWKRNEN